MTLLPDTIMIALPRQAVEELPVLSKELTDLMYELSVRSTAGKLTTTEQTELDTLTKMARFAQIVTAIIEKTDVTLVETRTSPRPQSSNSAIDSLIRFVETRTSPRPQVGVDQEGVTLPPEFGVSCKDSNDATLAETQTSPRESGMTFDFIDRAKRLEQMGLTDTALDLIYDEVDELLHGGNFALCASLLQELDVCGCSIDILLGLLTVTLPAKNSITTRPPFVQRVEAELRRRGQFEEGLLQGLA